MSNHRLIASGTCEGNGLLRLISIGSAKEISPVIAVPSKYYNPLLTGDTHSNHWVSNSASAYETRDGYIKETIKRGKNPDDFKRMSLRQQLYASPNASPKMPRVNNTNASPLININSPSRMVLNIQNGINTILNNNA